MSSSGSSITTRAASGFLLLGRAGSAGTSSRQRIHPARARWMTRCTPLASMSRNLPWRLTPSTSVPCSACSGGSNVFSALKAVRSTRLIARPTRRPRRSSDEGFDLGELGHAPESRQIRVGGVTIRTWPGSALPRTGAVFLDPRGEDRSLRVTWHQEAQLVVLSLWRDNVCAGTFRLSADEVPDLDRAAAPRARRGLRHRPRARRAARPAGPGGLRRRRRGSRRPAGDSRSISRYRAER